MYCIISALHAGMREAVVVLRVRTHSSWLVPPGWELSGTGRQVPLEIHAGIDGALGKAFRHLPNSCIHEYIAGVHLSTRFGKMREKSMFCSSTIASST